MTRRHGVIFVSNRRDKPTLKDLDGDSGVGQAPEFPSKSLRVHSKTSVRSKSTYVQKLGNVLILIAVIGVLFSYGPILKAELIYRIETALPKKEVEKQGSFAQVLAATLTGPSTVPDPNFSLVIPKIQAKAKIIANVDPTNEIEYFDALKQGVAHAKGTDMPGGNGTIYLFAHSTDSAFNALRFNAVFYLLRELEKGDEVDIYFAGIKHHYIVTDKRIVEPTDTTYLSATNQVGREQVILQTCWPPGTRLKRLLIFAQKAI